MQAPGREMQRTELSAEAGEMAGHVDLIIGDVILQRPVNACECLQAGLEPGHCVANRGIAESGEVTPYEAMKCGECIEEPMVGFPDGELRLQRMCHGAHCSLRGDCRAGGVGRCGKTLDKHADSHPDGGLTAV